MEQIAQHDIDSREEIYFKPSKRALKYILFIFLGLFLDKSACCIRQLHYVKCII